MTRVPFKAEDSQTKAILKEFSLNIKAEDFVYDNTEFLNQCKMKVFTDCMKSECQRLQDTCENPCIRQSSIVDSKYL